MLAQSKSYSASGARTSAGQRAKIASAFWESAIWWSAYVLKPRKTEPHRRHLFSSRNARRESPSGTRVGAMHFTRQPRQRDAIFPDWGRTRSGGRTLLGGNRLAEAPSKPRKSP